MEVRGVSSASPPLPVDRPELTPGVEKSPPTGAISPKDEVEISTVGKMLDDASRTPGVREQRLAEIKAAIENGTYETPEKLELALSRMVEQLKLNSQ